MTLATTAVLLLVLGGSPAASGKPGAPPEKKDFASLTLPMRRALLEGLDEPGRRAVLEKVGPEAWLKLNREAVSKLGVYRVTLQKVERVDGEVLPEQTLELFVREKPQAIYAEYVKGPAKGRRLLYNSELRKDELRVKEAGMLGFAGAVWLSLDSGMTRKDSNHPANRLGFGPLSKLLEQEIERARPFGGLRRTSASFKDGLWCNRYEAPPGAKGLYAQSTEVCGDPASGLPTSIEVRDAEGFLERLRYLNVRPQAALPAGAFTPDGHGL